MNLHITFHPDHYINDEKSQCLRSQDKYFDIRVAKSACSNNFRCVGIAKFNSYNYEQCLDALYTSTAWNKYDNFSNILVRKSPSYGR